MGFYLNKQEKWWLFCKKYFLLIDSIMNLKRQLISRLFPLCVGGTHVQNSVISSTRASESKSHNFLLQSGLIQPASNGVFYYLPTFLRSIEKLSNLIDFHMKKCDSQKLSLPALGTKVLWD